MTRDRRIPLPDADPDGNPNSYQPALSAEVYGYYRATNLLKELDPVVTEMVRLRCARHHDCRICQAVRLRDARAEGLDDAMAAKVDFFEQSDLDERTKAALRYADAFITEPSAIDAKLARELADHFTPAQIVELSLDIMKWSNQKISVTLGLDVMPGVDIESGAVTFFEFDEFGAPTNFAAAEDDSLARA